MGVSTQTEDKTFQELLQMLLLKKDWEFLVLSVVFFLAVSIQGT